MSDEIEIEIEIELDIPSFSKKYIPPLVIQLNSETKGKTNRDPTEGTPGSQYGPAS